MDTVLTRILIGLLVLALILFPTGDLYAARLFNGTSDYMNSSATVNLSATATVTIAFWLYQTTYNTSNGLASESTTNYNSNNGAYAINPNSTNGFEFDFHGPSGYSTNWFAQPTGGVWHQVTLVIPSSTAGTAYIDGTLQTLTSAPKAANGNFGNFTIYLMSRGGTTLFNTGRLTEFAIWNIALTSGNATSLAGGALATSISPGNLVLYIQNCGTSNPEPDSSGNGHTFAVTGTTQIAQPPSVNDCSAASCNNHIALLGAGCR